jgi:hypothetical protein
MIRSTRIPSVLNRICDDYIISALLVTADGELLGASSKSAQKNTESFGTLLADIALDYHRLGEEFSTVDEISADRTISRMECLLINMDLGLIGITPCSGCFVIAVAKPDAPPGLMKARLQTLATHVQESLSALTETS